MSDESRHRINRGRPLRTAQRSTEARRRSNARGAAANANRKKPVQEIDWDRAIANLKVMLDEMGYDE